MLFFIFHISSCTNKTNGYLKKDVWWTRLYLVLLYHYKIWRFEVRRTAYLNILMFMLDIFERNVSYKQCSSVNCFRESLSIQSEISWLPSRTYQVPFPFSFLCLCSCIMFFLSVSGQVRKRHLSFFNYQYYMPCQWKNKKVLVVQIPVMSNSSHLIKH